MLTGGGVSQGKGGIELSCVAVRVGSGREGKDWSISAALAGLGGPVGGVGRLMEAQGGFRRTQTGGRQAKA